MKTAHKPSINILQRWLRELYKKDLEYFQKIGPQRGPDPPHKGKNFSLHFWTNWTILHTLKKMQKIDPAQTPPPNAEFSSFFLLFLLCIPPLLKGGFQLPRSQECFTHLRCSDGFYLLWWCFSTTLDCRAVIYTESWQKQLCFVEWSHSNAASVHYLLFFLISSDAHQHIFLISLQWGIFKKHHKFRHKITNNKIAKIYSKKFSSLFFKLNKEVY